MGLPLAAGSSLLLSKLQCQKHSHAKVKVLMGINDRPGWSVMSHVSKHPSHVGACYSCKLEGIAVYGSSKSRYRGL